MFNPDNLRHFYGTENYYYRRNPDLLKYTDGIHYLNDGASWLIDAVESHLLTNRKAQQQSFQLWCLEKISDDHWELTMRRDTNNKPIVRQVIPYSSFPLAKFEWYVVNGIMMLKSEY